MSCKDGSVAPISWHWCLLEVMTGAVTGERAGRVLPHLAVLTATLEPTRQLSRPHLLAQVSGHGFFQGLSGSQLGFPDPQSPQGWWAKQTLASRPPTPFLELSTEGGVGLPG